MNCSRTLSLSRRPYWGGTSSPSSITSMKPLIWSRHIRKENEGSPSFRGNVKQRAIKNNKQWSYKDYHEIKLCLKHFLQVKTWVIYPETLALHLGSKKKCISWCNRFSLRKMIYQVWSRSQRQLFFFGWDKLILCLGVEGRENSYLLFYLDV